MKEEGFNPNAVITDQVIDALAMSPVPFGSIRRN